ncbi:MAG: hypothetical protein P8189_30825, partial [Anaerolineae bacterium]
MTNQVNSRIRLGVSVLLLVMAGLAQAGTITVGPGVDYDFDTIQAGIDAAVDGDTVLVAPGEYVITEPITFWGKAITLQSETGPNETIIRMGTPADTNRGSVVVFENNETDASVLDGFTITGSRNGNWFPSDSQWGGGGILFVASSGTVRNCIIVQNSTEVGGGVFLWSGSSTILTNCIITKNSAGFLGGGVVSARDSFLTMADCIISSNTTTNSGGGAVCWYNGSLTLTNCIVRDNSAENSGGGLVRGGGQNSSITATDCAIMNNTARQQGGGGLDLADGSGTLINCIIAQNMGGLWGGGLLCVEPSSSTAIINCTIYGNSAGEDGGGLGCYNGASATLTNSIVRANTAPKGQAIYLEQNPTTFSISYSDVADDQTSITVDDGSILSWGEGNIDTDPLFADPNNSDFHLKSEVGHWDPNSGSWVKDDVTSPCIDAGDPNSDWSGETWPHGERTNMGAYGGAREASMSTRPEVMSLPRVAFFYRSNTEAAESFRSLLMRYGCPTTLIGIDDVETAVLDFYDVIIVASDAGYASTWQDTQFVATLEGSGKPVIGLGEGGYNFFGVLDLWIGRPNGGHGSKNNIEVVDPNCSLFSTPYSVDIPENRALQLYTETSHIGIYLWPTIPETVTVLASEVNDVGYFPLVMEHNRYLLWGFMESPLKMTEVGKILFVNVVIWTANAEVGAGSCACPGQPR